MIKIALIFNLLDFLTGFVGALRAKKIHSSKMRDGLFKKTGFVFLYLIAWLLDTYGGEAGLTIPVSIVAAVCFYAIMTEIVSIAENISRINPDLIPSKILALLSVDNITAGEVKTDGKKADKTKKSRSGDGG